MRKGLYTDPMIYDILYSPGTAAEVTTFERIETLHASKPLAENRVWLEPACGTGRYLRVAARRGRTAIGFDLDSGQITYAKNRVKFPPQGESSQYYFTADMRNFLDAAATEGLAANSVDFAFNPVNSIRHLENDQEMLEHLNQMAGILKPGSVYAVGISLTDYDWLMAEEDLWEASRGQCKVSQLINFLPPEPGTKRARIETAVSHLTVTRPRGQEHVDDHYNLRTYDTHQWRELIAQSVLQWAGSYDAWGKILGSRTLPYQIEVLQAPF